MDMRLTKYIFFWFYTNSSPCSYELQLHMELSQNSSCTQVPIALRSHKSSPHLGHSIFLMDPRFGVNGYNMCVQYFTVILRCKGKCSIYWLLWWLNNVAWAQVGYPQFKMQRPRQLGPIWVLSKCVCLPVAQSIVALAGVFTIHPTTDQHSSSI